MFIAQNNNARKNGKNTKNGKIEKKDDILTITYQLRTHEK